MGAKVLIPNRCVSFTEEKKIRKTKITNVYAWRKLKVDGRVKAELVSGRYNMK